MLRTLFGQYPELATVCFCALARRAAEGRLEDPQGDADCGLPAM